MGGAILCGGGVTARVGVVQLGTSRSSVSVGDVWALTEYY